jgi:hypothetical protein
MPGKFHDFFQSIYNGIARLTDSMFFRIFNIVGSAASIIALILQSNGKFNIPNVPLIIILVIGAFPIIYQILKPPAQARRIVTIWRSFLVIVLFGMFFGAFEVLTKPQPVGLFGVEFSDICIQILPDSSAIMNRDQIIKPFNTIPHITETAFSPDTIKGAMHFSIKEKPSTNESLSNNKANSEIESEVIRHDPNTNECVSDFRGHYMGPGRIYDRHTYWTVPKAFIPKHDPEYKDDAVVISIEYPTDSLRATVKNTSPNHKWNKDSINFRLVKLKGTPVGYRDIPDFNVDCIARNDTICVYKIYQVHVGDTYSIEWDYL